MKGKNIGRKRGLIYLPESNGLVRGGWYVQVIPAGHVGFDRAGMAIQLWFVVPFEAVGNGKLRRHVRLAWVRMVDPVADLRTSEIVLNKSILLSTGTGSLQTAWAFN